MTENKAGDKDPNKASTDWINLVSDFWSPIMNTWGAGMQPTSQPSEDQQDPQDGSSASMQAFAQIWQTLIKRAGEPMGMAYSQQTSQAAPEMLMGFAQSCLSNFTRFQSTVKQWLENQDGNFSMDDTESLRKEFLQGCTDTYEKEFSQFFKIPQIGLGRVYQERVMQAADKYNLFQGAFSKFLHELYLPMNEAFQRLQQQMAEHAETDQLEEDPKTYYNLWVKFLEEHYMTLFKTPDFSETLGQTLGALNEYSLAKQAVVNDMLKQNDIPTHEDLDELYKEIYLLKKRMRRYEKQ